MNTKLYFLTLIALFLVSCQTTGIVFTDTPTPVLNQAPTLIPIPPSTAAPTTILPTSEALPLTATLLAPTAIIPTTSPIPPTLISTPIIQPVVKAGAGAPFEKIFTIPEGGNNPVKYFRGAGGVEGPNAIGVLPDGSFLIADPMGNQLLHFGISGQLLNTNKLQELGIKNVLDMRIKGNDLYLLETSYENYKVHHLTIDGDLLSSEEIPSQFPVYSRYTLESVLTGIAVDCEKNVVLELKNGRELYPLAWFQNHPDLTGAVQGYSCNNINYWIESLSPPRISAGDQVYETRLTTQFGSLNILDIFPDGRAYIVRSDLLSDQPGSQRDMTIHYIVSGEDINLGVARVMPPEFYYPVMRSMAVGPDGEVYALMPMADSIDIVRLNFYTNLEPLVPGAAAPQITISPNK